MSILNLVTRKSPKFVAGGGEFSVEFDAVLSDTLESEVVFTEYPLENGAVASDHGIIMPKRWSMSGAISNNPLKPTIADFAVGAVSSLIDPAIVSAAGVVAGNIASVSGSDNTRASNALELLIELQESRVPFSVNCGDITLENMCITKLTRTKTPENEGGLEFEAELQEIPTIKTLFSDPTADEVDATAPESAQSVKKSSFGEVGTSASSFVGGLF